MEQAEGRNRLVEIIARHLPELDIRSLRRLGEGIDNAAWVVNGELVIRQGKDPDRAARAEAVRREATLLVAVSRFSPLPVPEPVFTDAETGLLAYPRLPGVPLKWSSHIRPESLAPALGGFLDAIHGMPVAVVEPVVERDVYPLDAWLRDAARDYAIIADRLTPSQRSLVEDFLGHRPSPEPDTLVFCHNDLGSEHVLVDPESGTLTGIIDWSDAAIADPARDFALLYRDLGPVALEKMLASYRRPPAGVNASVSGFSRDARCWRTSPTA